MPIVQTLMLKKLVTFYKHLVFESFISVLYLNPVFMLRGLFYWKLLLPTILLPRLLPTYFRTSCHKTVFTYPNTELDRHYSVQSKISFISTNL